MSDKDQQSFFDELNTKTLKTVFDISKILRERAQLWRNLIAQQSPSLTFIAQQKLNSTLEDINLKSETLSVESIMALCCIISELDILANNIEQPFKSDGKVKH